MLHTDGEKAGEGRVETTVPMMFSADETSDVGRGTGSAVLPDYDPRDNEFTGEVNWVQIDLEQDGHDHMISPETGSSWQWRDSELAQGRLDAL